MISRDYFKGKRIAMIGLGSHGEMVEDAAYLVRAGAFLAIYDLRTEARVNEYLLPLKTLGLANHVTGTIPADDLIDMDLIILSHEYPRDSSFLIDARAKDIPIEYPETFFFKHAPPVTMVGVMGVCGKSTVVSMLSPLLQSACSTHEKQGFFTIDPESDEGIIARLKKVKSGDVILVRMTDMMMRELHAIRISPHVAIFTSIPPKGSFEGSPFEIISYQTYNNFIIAPDSVIDATYTFKFQTKAKMLRTKASYLPADWEIAGTGVHDRDNAALALQTARLFKVPDDVAQTLLSRWKALKGRLEFVKKVKNVEFYNDTASIIPHATETALKTLGNGRNIVLMFGGAVQEADYADLYRFLPEHVHTLILLPGSGTMRERHALQGIHNVRLASAPSIEEGTRLALEYAEKGDRVIFSPGFNPGGFDMSRKGRGERFVKCVRGL